MVGMEGSGVIEAGIGEEKPQCQSTISYWKTRRQLLW